MKRTVAWAIVNDHGKIPCFVGTKALHIYPTKRRAMATKVESDQVVKVVIERQSLSV